MAAKGFDYENFAQNLAAQAQDLVPPEFSPEEKQYVINTLGNFSMMAGKALAEDKNLPFDVETVRFVISGQENIDRVREFLTFSDIEFEEEVG